MKLFFLSKKKSKLFDQFLNILEHKLRQLPDSSELTNFPEVLVDLLRKNSLKFNNPELFKTKDGRVIARYGVKEKILLSCLYDCLYEFVDKKLQPNCIGGRRGFSRYSLFEYLKLAKQKKLNWVLVSDIKDFFASISHEIVFKLLTKKFHIPKDVVDLLKSLFSLGVADIEPKGIFCGNPLGKLVGNVYLSCLDDFLVEKGLTFCRYIDDIIVFLKTKQQAEQTLSEIKEFLLKNLSLSIAENKTGIFHRYYNRFEFLGFSIIGENIFASEENIKRFIEVINRLPYEYSRKRN